MMRYKTSNVSRMSALRFKYDHVSTRYIKAFNIQDESKFPLQTLRTCSEDQEG